MSIRLLASAIAVLTMITGTAVAQNAKGEKSKKGGPIEKLIEKQNEAVRINREKYEQANQRALDVLSKELERLNAADADGIVRKFRYEIAVRDARAAPPTPPAPNPALNAAVWEFGGHRYQILQLPMQLSWNSARVECHNRGGHLVTVETRSEQDFLNKMLLQCLETRPQLNRNTCVWLGLYRADATQPFVWIDNRMSEFKNWSFPVAQTQHKYGVMRMDDGGWRDVPGDSQDIYTLCEWDTVR